MASRLAFALLTAFAICSWDNRAHAQTPNAPQIIDAGAAGCIPTDEICGDGIDQNCDGSDMPCPGSDADRDGFPVSGDCSDSDRNIYPGVYTECTTAGGPGTRLCQTNGTYTACSTTPLCEATGTGKCYYISSLTGSDSNAGTFASPWKTYRNVVSYYSATERPAKGVTLVAGDVVYFMSGLYTDTYSYSGSTRGFFLRSVSGTSTSPVAIKAYPGTHPVFAPSSNAIPIWVSQSHNVKVQGLEVTRGWGAGVRFDEGTGMELSNSWIHDIDGVDNDNLAGLYVVGINGLKAHHNLIHDNYDRTNSDTGGMRTQNSRNVVLFSGGNIKLSYNVIFQTPIITASKTGGCVTYKHSASVAGSTFEADHNILWNCYYTAIGSGSFNSNIHHNVIINSDPIQFADFGGITHIENELVEYNTIIGGNGMNYNPTTSYGPLGNVTFRKNVISDTGPYHSERGMINIHPYGSDTLYNATMGKLFFSQNCYYNSAAALMFNLFNRNGGAYGVQGNAYSFSGWQGLGYDAGSQSINPQLDASQVPANAACKAWGWLPQ